MSGPRSVMSVFTAASEWAELAPDHGIAIERDGERYRLAASEGDVCVLRAVFLPNTEAAEAVAAWLYGETDRLRAVEREAVRARETLPEGAAAASVGSVGRATDEELGKAVFANVYGRVGWNWEPLASASRATFVRAGRAAALLALGIPEVKP